MGRRILITGGSGFIGSHLQKLLLSQGAKISAPDLNLEDPRSIENAVGDSPWDAVIHLAAVSAYSFCESHLARTFSINAMGTALLARAVANRSPKAQLIFASTAQVYAPPSPHDMNQKMVIDEDSPVAAKNVYAESKILAEQILRSYSERYGLNVTILRIFNHTHKTQAPDFFLPHIYQSLINRKPNHQAIVPVGNLNLRRDIGSIFDLVSAFASVIKMKDELGSYEIFNVCSGKARQLRALADLLASRLKAQAEYQLDPSRVRPNEIEAFCGSSKRLHEKTGWQPRHLSDEDLIESFFKE